MAENEKIVNSIISEEALEDIAGGLKIDKATLKKYLIGAGVTIAAAGTLAGVWHCRMSKNKLEYEDDVKEREKLEITGKYNNITPGFLKNYKGVCLLWQIQTWKKTSFQRKT